MYYNLRRMYPDLNFFSNNTGLKGRRQKDNYDLRVYIALLNRSSYASELSREFAKHKELSKHSELINNNKLSGRFNSLRKKKILLPVKKPEKISDPYIVTSNKAILMDFVKLSNPKVDDEYDINRSISIFSDLVHMYHLEFHPKINLLHLYIFLTIKVYESVKNKKYDSNIKQSLDMVSVFLEMMKKMDIIDFDLNLGEELNKLNRYKCNIDKDFLLSGLDDYFLFFADCMISTFMTNKSSELDDQIKKTLIATLKGVKIGALSTKCENDYVWIG